jgi:hypothetical protein
LLKAPGVHFLRCLLPIRSHHKASIAPCSRVAPSRPLRGLRCRSCARIGSVESVRRAYSEDGTRFYGCHPPEGGFGAPKSMSFSKPQSYRSIMRPGLYAISENSSSRQFVNRGIHPWTGARHALGDNLARKRSVSISLVRVEQQHLRAAGCTANQRLYSTHTAPPPLVGHPRTAVSKKRGRGLLSRKGPGLNNWGPYSRQRAGPATHER